MKKTLVFIVVFMICSIVAFAQMNVVVKGGVQLLGNENVKGGGFDNNFEINMGFVGAVELTYNQIPFVEAGGGIEYQFERELTDYTDEKISYVPVYALVRGKLEMPMFSPYAVGKIGYGLYLPNDAHSGGTEAEGGLYWSLGAGTVIMGLIVVEVAYSFNYGSIGTADMTYSHLDISAGISYSF